MNPVNNRNSKVNKLQGEYLSSKLNHCWTIDVTTIKNKYYFFFIMDLTSRRIVHYNVSPRDYTAPEACLILYKALEKENSVVPFKRVSYVHTDSAGIFLSKEWLECLSVNEILPSSSDSEHHQNQVSERFNRTFKILLREYLNKKLNKKNNKTNTFQLVGEATKYNFSNLEEIVDDIILYYNTKRPHMSLHGLTPDTFARKIRTYPDQNYLIEEKSSSLDEEITSPLCNEAISVCDESLLSLPKEELINRIEEVQNTSLELPERLKNVEAEIIVENMYSLSKKNIIPFDGSAKNDNSLEAKHVRIFRNGVASAEVLDQIKERKIDVSKWDKPTQKLYESSLNHVKNWEGSDVLLLETLRHQNYLLLRSIEELKEKTTKLEVQNEELLSMNKYLVETTERVEEEKKLALERKEKRRRAKKQDRREYITSEEFYEIMFNHIYKCEDSMYIISRNRLAFFLMYFTGLRVSNLLLLKVRNLKELMNDKIGTELQIIKGGRANQLISLGDDAQRMLSNEFYDNVCASLKDKEDDYPVFTSEKNRLVALHRVTFTESLNKTLKYSSKEFRKKLSCHSFRATFITTGLMK